MLFKDYYIGIDAKYSNECGETESKMLNKIRTSFWQLFCLLG